MKTLETAYLCTILNEEQRTLLRFAAYLNIPVLIDGLPNPTGKSTLAEYLRSLGVNAIEMWDVREEAKSHKVDVDMLLHGKGFIGNTAHVVITLNKTLRTMTPRLIDALCGEKAGSSALH